MKTVIWNLLLDDIEIIELKYLYALGFRYIGRHEKGTLEVFKKEPIRNISKTSAYSIWVIEDNFPIRDFSEYGDIKLGKYDFITWNDGIYKIEDLI